MTTETVLLCATDILLLFTSCMMWRSYNSGIGGALGSRSKRIKLAIAIVLFTTFIFLTNILLGNTCREAILEIFNNLVFAFLVAFLIFVYENKMII